MACEIKSADKELFSRFSDAEYARRYSAIRAAMQKDNIDAILISGARGAAHPLEP